MKVYIRYCIDKETGKPRYDNKLVTNINSVFAYPDFGKLIENDDGQLFMPFVLIIDVGLNKIYEDYVLDFEVS